MDLIDSMSRYVSVAFPFEQTSPLVSHHRICIFTLGPPDIVLERYLRKNIMGPFSSPLELEGFKNEPN